MANNLDQPSRESLVPKEFCFPRQFYLKAELQKNEGRSFLNILFDSLCSMVVDCGLSLAVLGKERTRTDDAHGSVPS